MIQNLMQRIGQYFSSRSVTLTLLGALATTGCGNDPPRGLSDRDITPGMQETIVPAGSVGKCVEVEVYPGYSTCVMDEPQEYQGPARSRQALADLPEAVNLRLFIDENCPPVHSQGNCGWCVPHSVTAAMEIQECHSSGAERISEPHLWYLGKGSVDDCIGGWQIQSALQTASRNRLVSQEVWPYSTREGQMSRSRPADSILEEEGKYSLDSFTSLAAGDLEGVKLALAERQPVLYSVPVFCDTGWYHGLTSGEQDIRLGYIRSPELVPRPCVSGGEVFTGCEDTAQEYCRSGYHAIAIVGYDDSSETFLLRNSWGSGWADEGYGSITYDYIREFGRGGAALEQEEVCLATSTEARCEGNMAKVYDNCGALVDEQRCEEEEVCEEGVCRPVECLATSTEARCEGNMAKVYDNCGALVDEQRCDDEEVCEEGACVPDCNASFTNVCHEGDVYQQDACGSIESLVEDCLPDEVCIDGVCNAISSGGRIVFVSYRDGNDEIYVMNGDGSGQTRLTNNSAQDKSPIWSPDGTKIIFSSDRDGGHSQIYVMNADGSDPTRLTNNFGNYDAAWSPDGTKIAFTSSRDGNNEIYVMNADGTEQTRLTNNSAHDGDPVWSPDGTKIAFTSQRNGISDEIYVMNADGSNQTNLTNNPASDSHPIWSPDGTKIAFHSTRYRNTEIYVMNADGSGRTRLTNNSARERNLAWSPDGTKIVFESIQDEKIFEIYVMNGDGSGQTRLTNNSAHNWDPVWSPDGTKIAFTSRRDGSAEIYVMNADGIEQVNITNSPGADYSSNWTE